MSSKEQKINQGESPDLPKEKDNHPIFVARFGVGPHGIRVSNWHNDLKEDLDSFFTPSDSEKRNIFYMEDALGSQQFISNAKRAYKVYGSWATAYFWADIIPGISKKLGLIDEERFPSPDKLDSLITTKIVSTASRRVREGYYFTKTVLEAIDEISAKKNITIELQTENRKNAQERSTVENAIRFLDENQNLGSSLEMRDWIMRSWSLRNLRDSRVIDDLEDLYKKAHRQKTQIKVYVSLGGDHVGCEDLLIKRLGQRPSYNVSFTRGSVYPQYEDPSSFDKPARFRVVSDKAHALLDSCTQISNDRWQRLFEEFSTPPK